MVLMGLLRNSCVVLSFVFIGYALKTFISETHDDSKERKEKWYPWMSVCIILWCLGDCLVPGICSQLVQRAPIFDRFVDWYNDLGEGRKMFIKHFFHFLFSVIVFLGDSYLGLYVLDSDAIHINILLWTGVGFLFLSFSKLEELEGVGLFFGFAMPFIVNDKNEYSALAIFGVASVRCLSLIIIPLFHYLLESPALIDNLKLHARLDPNLLLESSVRLTKKLEVAVDVLSRRKIEARASKIEVQELNARILNMENDHTLKMEKEVVERENALQDKDAHWTSRIEDLNRYHADEVQKEVAEREKALQEKDAYWTSRIEDMTRYYADEVQKDVVEREKALQEKDAYWKIRIEDVKRYYIQKVQTEVAERIKAVQDKEDYKLKLRKKVEEKNREVERIKNEVEGMRISLEQQSQDLNKHINETDEAIQLLNTLNGVNFQVEDGTPLIFAARNAQEKALAWLLKHGANPNFKSKDNTTPLSSAVAAGSHDCVDLLINAGATGGATPLHIVADEGSTKIMERSAADPDAPDQAASRAQRVASQPYFSLGNLHPAVKWAEEEPEVDPQELSEIKVAFVRSLPSDTDENSLKRLFEPFGKVEKVVVSKKGSFPVGFVHFYERSDLEQSIKALHDKEIQGPRGGSVHKLQVEVARPFDKTKKRAHDTVESNLPVQGQSKHLKEQPTPNVLPITSHSSLVQKIQYQVPLFFFQHGIESTDPYGDAVVALPLAVKERLLQILLRGIATRFDIDVSTLRWLKELPESTAISILDQLLSGSFSQNVGVYLAELISGAAQHGMSNDPGPSGVSPRAVAPVASHALPAVPRSDMYPSDDDV